MEIGKMYLQQLWVLKSMVLGISVKEEDIRRIVGENKTNMKIAVMADIGRSLKKSLS